MSITLGGYGGRALIAASGQFIIIGDDGLPYRLFLQSDGAGGQVLSLEPYTQGLDGTRNFSRSPSIGSAFYLMGTDSQWHRFNMVSDGPGTGTYGLQDNAQTATLPVPVDFTVTTARFDNGIAMIDIDGAGTHTVTVTSGTLTQSG